MRLTFALKAFAISTALTWVLKTFMVWSSEVEAQNLHKIQRWNRRPFASISCDSRLDKGAVEIRCPVSLFMLWMNIPWMGQGTWSLGLGFWWSQAARVPRHLEEAAFIPRPQNKFLMWSDQNIVKDTKVYTGTSTVNMRKNTRNNRNTPAKTWDF